MLIFQSREKAKREIASTTQLTDNRWFSVLGGGPFPFQLTGDRGDDPKPVRLIDGWRSNVTLHRLPTSAIRQTHGKWKKGIKEGHARKKNSCLSYTKKNVPNNRSVGKQWKKSSRNELCQYATLLTLSLDFRTLPNALTLPHRLRVSLYLFQ